MNVAAASRKDQIPVVVETVTKSSTIKTFAAAQPLYDPDASKVTSTGAGLQSAQINKDATFSVDTGRAGNSPHISNVYDIVNTSCCSNDSDSPHCYRAWSVQVVLARWRHASVVLDGRFWTISISGITNCNY